MNRLICSDTPGTAETADPDGFEKACADALALAKMMGDGWFGKVWENLGWHYQAVSPCGRVDIHPSIFDGQVQGYSAYLHEKDSTGMPSHLGKPPHAKLPRVAYAKLVNQTRAHIRSIQALVEGL